METIEAPVGEIIRSERCNEEGEILLFVEYYKSFGEVIIVDETKHLINIPHKNIPLLIELLQSIY